MALSSFETTCHIGAHADAPAHFAVDQPTIDQVDLRPYWGPCLVLDVPTDAEITPDCIPIPLQNQATRVLFKTKSHADHRKFSTKFAYFAEATIDLLGEQGVCLVGIDTPSVDVFDSKDLPAHHALRRHSMRNLEGLDLSQVEAGCYELVAVPLKLVGFDGSPVRALLRVVSL